MPVLFALHLFAVFFIYCILTLTPNYSLDAYTQLAWPYQSFIGLDRFIQLSRICAGLSYSLLTVIFRENPLYMHKFVSMILVVALGLTSYLLTSIFSKKVRDLTVQKFIAINLASLLTVANILYVEYFLFSEALLMFGGGAIFAVFGVNAIAQKRSFKNCLSAFFLLVISLSFYQNNIATFLISACAVLLIDTDFKLNKKNFYEFLKVGVTAVSAIAFSLLLHKILSIIMQVSSGNRTVGFRLQDIPQNLRFIWDTQVTLFSSKGSGYLGIGIINPIMLLCGPILLLILIIVRQKNLKDILWNLLVIFGCYLSVFSTYLAAQNGWMYLAPRVIAPLYSFWGIMFVLIIYILQENHIRLHQIISYIMYPCIAIFLIVNIVQVQNISVDRIVSNSIDKLIAEVIEKEIEHYESENQIFVDKIAFYNDLYPRYLYWKYTDQANILSPWNYDWARGACLNFYTGRTYEYLQPDDQIYTRYFKDKNWDDFVPSEQIVFVDNIAHIVCP